MTISASRDTQLTLAYVCKEFGPVTGGGIGTYIYNVCMAMASKGHRVFLVTDCFNENNRHLLPEGVNLVPVKETPGYRKGSYMSSAHEYSYRVYETLSELLREERIDVAEFAEFGCEGFASIRAKRVFNDFSDTKLIVKLHTPTSLLYHINEDTRLDAVSSSSSMMEDYCVRYADMVTSPSLSLGEYFENRVGRKDIRKCPYPMELPEREGDRKFTGKQVKTVRFIGSVQIRKGIDTFIDAAVKVIAKQDDFLFEIWGADRSGLTFGKNYTEVLQKKIPESLRDKIVFKGGIPYSEIPALFRDSCICIYPSRWENWANVCLEAMSYGCVVLASREGGMSEMIEDGHSGFVIDPLDSDQVSRIVLEISADKSRLHSISKAAKQRSAHICDPERTASEIENNYKRGWEKKEWTSSESNAPLVSVIVPYYNQPKYLEETIQSIRQSTYPNIEIVVVNDGSTTEEANRCFDRIEDVLKVNKENGGLSSARNAGIEASNGVFFLPLDADDLLEPDYISKGVDALTNNPDLGYVSCHARNFGELDSAYVPLGYVPELMLFINTHGKCSNLYRREVYDKCGGYDELMNSYEDWDYLITLEENNIEGDVLPAEFFKYRRHYDSMVYVTANRQRADLIQYMLIKHQDALSAHAGKMAIILARLWKETEMRHEFAEQQVKNAYIAPPQLGQLQDGNETRLQVYSAVNGAWREQNSVYVDFKNQSWWNLKVNLPFGGYRGQLRIDPSNLPGTVVIKDITLREKRFGRALFRANSDNNFAGLGFSSQVEHEVVNGFLVLRMFDNDPQILIDKKEATGNLNLHISLCYSADDQCDAETIIGRYEEKTLKAKVKQVLLLLAGRV